MNSLTAKRYRSSVTNPSTPSNAQLHSAAVIAYKQARAIVTAIRLGSGPFSVLTPEQRAAAIDQLLGVPTQSERERIEADAAAQRQDASRIPSARRTSPVAASQRRQIEANRPTNCVVDRGYAYR